jgi:hypothetical protein
MSFDIRLESKEGKLIEDMPDLESLLSRLLPSWEDSSFHLLRYLDPWGDTIFNRLQMEELMLELQRIRPKASTEEERAFVDSIGRMAERCKEGEGLYLKFLGD